MTDELFLQIIRELDEEQPITFHFPGGLVLADYAPVVYFDNMGEDRRIYAQVATGKVTHRFEARDVICISTGTARKKRRTDDY